MMVVMKQGATEEQIQKVVEKIKKAGLRPHISQGEFRTVIGIIGDERQVAGLPLEALEGVENVIPILKPFKFASRDFKQEDTIINVAGRLIGGGNFAVIAGPCSVETSEQMQEVAVKIKEAGATFLRGGAFKPRTSPYSFQGLGVEGLKLLAEARKITGLPVVTEVLDVRDVEVVSEYADVLQIGTRNMQNFILLLEAGKTGKPIVLKRGFGTTVEELLMAAEYVINGGSSQVILCERGIRTFEKYTRNTLDLSMIPVVKKLSHLPVIVDPSHATGKSELVPPMALAALAAGADGFMVEVHPHPDEAWCDGPQSITPQTFADLMAKVKQIAPVLEKRV